MWIHRCPTCCPAEAARSASSSTPVRRRQDCLTIDVHCHVFVPQAEVLVDGHPRKVDEVQAMLASMGAASVAHNNAVMLPAALPKLVRVEQRLADMDAMGVDVQVMSPSPNQYYYWADEELAHRLVMVQNEHIASLCAAHPSRLAGFGAVALQHPLLACEHLRRAVRDLGLKGVEISTSIAGRELSNPAFAPFWAEAEALGATIFIHPFGTTLGARTETHYLVNSVGQPLETAIALSHLIFSGTLDRHPRLKILAAHGGGYLPTSIGRSDQAFRIRPEASAQTAVLPSEQLKRIWFDTVVYDAMALRHLVDRVGASRVVVGTDYPFDMGYYNPHGMIAQASHLSMEERAAILGANAAGLIGWPQSN